MSRPEPDPARARRWLFAGDPPHPELAELEAGGIGPGPFDGIDLSHLTPQPPLRRGEGENGRSSSTLHAGKEEQKDHGSPLLAGEGQGVRFPRGGRP
jgi:hypothetical protein